MDSFTLNKIAGAILMVLLLTMGVGIVSDIIFDTNPPGQPGYEIVVADAGGEGGAGEAPAEATVEPIAVRLASADAAAGEKVAKKCSSCHVFTKGGENRVGPDLWGLIGRKPGSHEGFSYSSAMTEFGAANPEWTYDELDHFLTSPKEYVKGTIMGFAGLRKPEERADIIAYLRTLSDNPAPLPAAEAPAEAAPAEAAPAEAAPAEAAPAEAAPAEAAPAETTPAPSAN
ncbi:c-type cytochrome [Roseibium suaedae]|uniref:Cytochrome c n=1 Tax=Roseibium suaedae TaxID=735517 RepID=A0A1M6Z653_9HYPH|nr:cytochrome c family protein [Roseibium suaedae]SHL25882.1 cytochrome c [Roseibium suaedae]